LLASFFALDIGCVKEYCYR